MNAVATKAPDNRSSASLPETLSEGSGKPLRLHGTKTTELILVRHAEPDYRATPIGEDPCDLPLSEKGRWQAMRAAMRLRRMDIDAVFTSTMRRALETAVFIAAAKDLPMIRMRQLREIDSDSNVLAGTTADRQKVTAEVTIRFIESSTRYPLPDSNSSPHIGHPAIQAIKGILAHHRGQRIVVVTHSSVINACLSVILGIPREMFFLPEHTSFSVIRNLDGLSSMQSLNDFGHLLPWFSPQ